MTETYVVQLDGSDMVRCTGAFASEAAAAFWCLRHAELTDADMLDPDPIAWDLRSGSSFEFTAEGAVYSVGRVES
jgi:hypothetical protein